MQRSVPLRRFSTLSRGGSQLRRTPFKTKAAEAKAVPRRKAAPLAPVAPRQRSTATLARIDGGVKAFPKTVELRNPALLAMAMDRVCLLRVPGVCSSDPSTTVACHSNQARHGKAGARKADDQYSVWGCSRCHAWLDESRVAYENKSRAFDEALVRQLDAWICVANDPLEKDVDRKAARWALFQHGVPV